MERKVANGVALVGQHPYAPLVGAAAAITFHLDEFIEDAGLDFVGHAVSVIRHG